MQAPQRSEETTRNDASLTIGVRRKQSEQPFRVWVAGVQEEYICCRPENVPCVVRSRVANAIQVRVQTEPLNEMCYLPELSSNIPRCLKLFVYYGPSSLLALVSFHESSLRLIEVQLLVREDH